MALNLADRIAVRANLLPRCQAAVVNFALYVLNEDGGTANHANRVFWAKEAMQSPSSMADKVSWYVLNQPIVLS